MKTYHFIIIWLLLSFKLCAQNYDSLLNEVYVKLDTNQVLTLIKYGISLRSSDLDSALNTLDLAYRKAESIGFPQGQMNALINTGISYGMNDQYSEAILSFNEAIRLSNLYDDSNILSQAYNSLGIVYKRIGDYPTSYKYYNEALKVCEKRYYAKGVASAYENLGILHDLMGEYEESYSFYMKAYNIRDSLGDEQPMRHLMDNLAVYYTYTHDYAKAINTIKQNLIYYDSLKKNYNLVLGQNNLSDLYNRIEDYDSAIYFANQALQHANDPTLGRVIRNVYYNRSKAYLKKGNKEEALKDAFKYNEMIQPYGYVPKRNAAELLAEVYESLGEYEKSNAAYRDLISYNDSLFEENKVKEFKAEQIKQKVNEKNQQISALKFKQYQNKVRNRIYTIVAVSLLLTLVISFWAYRVTQRKKHRKLEERKKQLEKELEISQKKLSNHTLSMIQKNNVFEDIETELKGIRARCTGNIDPGLKKIQNEINLSRSLENDWNNFSSLFGELHSTFFSYFEKQHPELSDYEIRLCALIKMKLTNKEIATMLNIEHKSVKMAKYRLKKKLGIGEAVTLSDFIAQVE